MTSSSSLPRDVKSRLDQIWRKAYAARDREDLVDLYKDWSSTYERDHAAIGYVGHVVAAHVLARHLPPGPDVRVLDAGAGTGLAGTELARLGYGRLTAIDLSEAMLAEASAKGVYEDVRRTDLSLPLDDFATDAFDGAILVGVFSFGQAPAHALDEILRVVRPGGTIAFTMRTDFHEQDAMGVASKLAELEHAGAWRRVELSDPEKYLPLKDPSVLFRVWCYQVLPGKAPDVPEGFAEAVCAAFDTAGPVKPIAHHHIWDATASRLYDAYIRRPEYYLNDAEEEILRVNAGDFLGDRALCVELGCGSAQKIKHVFDAVLADDDEAVVEYMPIDLSPGALETTARQIQQAYGGRVRVDPRLGHFDETLASIPSDRVKAVFFLGGSIGNFETIEETVDFLAMVRERLTTRDRFVVGFDLCKEREVFEAAYNAGEENRTFFVHMVRRINHLLGADFDLDAFELCSSYEDRPDGDDLLTGRVNLRVRTPVAQSCRVASLDRTLALEAGDVVQVGVSRKFTPDAVAELATRAGLRVRSLWFDTRHAFSLAELVRDDAPAA